MSLIRTKMTKPGRRIKEVVFDSAGEDKEILGIVEARGSGSYEMVIRADHQAGDNKGNIKMRAIAEGGARVNLIGEIIIREGANGVDDFMDIKVLILDDKSSANVDPRLEIMANDVKASHAASVSMVDHEQMFYLSSRGLTKEEAKELLVEGFLRED